MIGIPFWWADENSNTKTKWMFDIRCAKQSSLQALSVPVLIFRLLVKCKMVNGYSVCASNGCARGVAVNIIVTLLLTYVFVCILFYVVQIVHSTHISVHDVEFGVCHIHWTFNRMISSRGGEREKETERNRKSRLNVVCIRWSFHFAKAGQLESVFLLILFIWLFLCVGFCVCFVSLIYKMFCPCRVVVLLLFFLMAPSVEKQSSLLNMKQHFNRVNSYIFHFISSDLFLSFYRFDANIYNTHLCAGQSVYLVFPFEIIFNFNSIHIRGRHLYDQYMSVFICFSCSLRT